MRCVPVALATLLLACGSRTGLSWDDAPHAEPIASDAGFDTFPCRWTLARATEIGTANSWVELQGAVHGQRDEVVVLGGEAAMGRPRPSGALLTLGDPPRIVERLRPEATTPLLGHAAGWVQAGSDGSACERISYDDSFAASLAVVLPGQCRLEPNDPQHLDLTWRLAEGVHVTSERLPDMTFEGEVLLSARPDYQRSVRLEGLGWLVLTLEDGWLSAYRARDGEVARVRLTPQREPFAVALDRVRPAAVVLRREGGWHLERIPFEGEPRLVALADLSMLPAEPTGDVVSNETEALFPLADGRVAVAPVDGSAVRTLGPPPEGPVADLRLVLRPGSSAGGLLYTQRRDGDEVLSFRPLVCNR